ncbi:ATP-binding protein [Nocardiopsis sp. NPDC007018]|uniref:AAA family ATPase n=1 Tax=Nocardiopsis sp. NPDC007018 TaxID=3155721 RepID=UPI00340E41DE
MLLSFRVENHKSIREEQQLLLTPVYDDARPESADWEAVTVAGVFGANASGKSNLLDALAFMRDTVRWSMNNAEPGGGIARVPFALDTESASEPSIFVVDLKLSGVRHTYGFAIDDERVTEEWLYTYPKGRRRVLFERDGAEFTFGDSTPAKLRQVKDITGPNILFLTIAARASNEDVEPIYRWFSDDLTFAEERRPGPPAWLTRQSVSEDRMVHLSELLKSAGTGVRSVELEPAPVSGETSTPFLWYSYGARDPHPKGIDSRFRESLTRRALAREGKRAAAANASHWITRITPPGLLFHHEGDECARPLTWDEESKGTRTLAALGYEAQRTLETGGVLLVDEIDASLHPYLSARVIALFQDEEQNPHGAQLVFTSHDAALLGRVRGEEVLMRDHIWFVDKDDRGRSTLYPLSDFKPRGDDSRARRYLVGRYGAVPDIDDELFRAALSRREAALATWGVSE